MDGGPLHFRGGTIADGVAGFESTTGRAPKVREYPVRKILANEVVYLVDFNVDGWAQGDWWNTPLPRRAPTSSLERQYLRYLRTASDAGGVLIQTCINAAAGSCSIDH